MSQELADQPDRTLIGLALNGETECFGIVIKRYLPALRGQIYSMVRDRAEVDDLIQQVLMKVWGNLGCFRAEASFRTWMTRIAINEVLQFYRRQKSRSSRQTTDDLDSIPAVCDTAQQHMIRIETATEVRRAVAGLPEKYRQVLVLREFEHLSLRQTAESTRASVPAVKSRLFRARRLLTAELRRPRMHEFAG
jgi:RNA polymerase sigma-70 factor, ECF subfamily